MGRDQHGRRLAEEAAPLPTIEVDFAENHAEEAEPLPTMGFDLDAGDAAEALPTMEIDTDDASLGADLPMMEVELDEQAASELPIMEGSEAFEDAVEEAVADASGIELEPVGAFGDPEPAPMLEEPAVEVETPTVEVEEPPVSEPQAVESTPASAAPPDGGFVDLGAMILGDTGEKTTRFTVQYEEPTGDEEADFARMLSQFKDKVSENLDSSDVRAHYDLGTAYKEMGLLDEAISSFQAALRASSDHLPTYELMGQTFMEMGQPEAAVKSLERALDAADTVEDELVGIYYYLGRAYEELQNRESAVEYYDRVFALDINFADVTERLRELR